MELKGVSLKDFTSLRIGGGVDMVVVRSEEGLLDAIMHAKAEGLRVHILGSGTNTYFGEDLSNLLVLKMEMKGIECEKKKENSKQKTEENSDSLQSTVYSLTSSAGESWDDIVKYAVARGLWGIENLSYIPGTIGAAPVQNIGAYGMELKDSLMSVRAYDLEQKSFVELTKEQCQFGYRDSLFKKVQGRYIITQVTLELSKEKDTVLTYKPLDVLTSNKDVTLQEIRDVVIRTRTLKLPDYNFYPNAGSFFKNPIVSSTEAEVLRAKYPEMPLIPHQRGFKIPAAWLIEHVAAMKGVRIGDLGTWPNQTLVLVNYNEASADDIDSLRNKIQQKVRDSTGIILEQEVTRVD